VLVLAIADFGTPRLLGRGFSVLATEAFTLYAAEVGSNMSMAATISVVLVLLSLASCLDKDTCRDATSITAI